MKKLVKKLAEITARNPASWAVLNHSVIKFSLFVDYYHWKQFRKNLLNSALETTIPDLTVRHGPFAGVQYPSSQAVGSALFPKLLGSYETELHPIICGTVLKTDYSEVIDVGCAEGYYAVGLLTRHPNTIVHAFDTEPRALEMCRKMAEINRVSDRLRLGAMCTAETLAEFPFTGKALIMSDCEGYEKELFTDKNRSTLKEHDLLVEVHDGHAPNVSDYLKDLFRSTHQIHSIEPISDHKKAIIYQYPELSSFSFDERKILLAEHRTNCTGWLFLQSQFNR
ncbi:methyltransferase [Desulfofustis glycolicus]|uniref:Methyltransferase small domain-containing protein n=1 Tax=Desulfofustis glycolicus DSM 9705 TaxID=1121409 RepID=A0A1M5WI17_9BACT|nr:methyltransferase [Desulfofustis glycolicus]MCB2216843.1 methyltransferase [Desulfobulbaceae bacterium]SHH87141.1 Methyltransferase small domain-containing protein [Desulfofustis glycolicus DSM 9705]